MTEGFETIHGPLPWVLLVDVKGRRRAVLCESEAELKWTKDQIRERFGQEPEEIKAYTWTGILQVSGLAFGIPLDD